MRARSAASRTAQAARDCFVWLRRDNFSWDSLQSSFCHVTIRERPNSWFLMVFIMPISKYRERLRRPRGRSQGADRQQTAKLRFEALEDRTLLSVQPMLLAD